MARTRGVAVPWERCHAAGLSDEALVEGREGKRKKRKEGVAERRREGKERKSDEDRQPKRGKRG